MLTLIPTPLGNLQDITYRAVLAFEKASLILCEDTRVTKRLFALLHERGILPHRIDAEFLSFNEHNGSERLRQIASRLAEEEVVYASDAGMPAISDPGQLLVRHCQERGIGYDVLPGPSAVTTAYAASGFPAGRFTFYGFLPHKGRERSEALMTLLRHPFDTVIYEAPHRLQKLLSEIADAEPEREIFAAKEISKKHQRYFRGSASVVLESILAAGEIRGEWVLILQGVERPERVLHLEEILSLDLPPKVKAKLLSRLSGEETKVWYQRLTQGASGKKG